MTRLRNASMDDLVKVESAEDYAGRPYWRIPSSDDRIGTTMSDAGVQMVAASARLFEEWRPVLEAWMEHFADVECPHGVPFSDEIWGWNANDYAFDLMAEPERAVFILDGYHEHAGDGDWYCLPAWFDAAMGAFTWDMQPSWYEASRGLQLGYLPKWVREALQ